MATQRRMTFVHAQTAWMLAAVVVLAVLDTLTVELFFIVSFIGLLIVMEITAPITAAATWRTRLRWVLLLAFATFGYTVLMNALRVFGIEVF